VDVSRVRLLLGLGVGIVAVSFASVLIRFAQAAGRSTFLGGGMVLVGIYIASRAKLASAQHERPETWAPGAG
jgi:hypothetical protein